MLEGGLGADAERGVGAMVRLKAIFDVGENGFIDAKIAGNAFEAAQFFGLYVLIGMRHLKEKFEQEAKGRGGGE